MPRLRIIFTALSLLLSTTQIIHAESADLDTPSVIPCYASSHGPTSRGDLHSHGMAFCEMGERVDIKSPYSSTPSSDSLPIGPAHLTSGEPSTSSRPSVSIFFSCSEKDEVMCKKANTAYQNVANTLSRVLKLNRDIKVRAEYTSFCKNLGQCEVSTLGQASSSMYFSINGVPNVDPNYWVPQPLAKQMVEGLPFAEYDIHAQFNADNPKDFNKKYSRFWFKGDPAIKQDQFDFEMVCMHELIHGLSFITALGTYLPGKSPNSSFPGLTLSLNVSMRGDDIVGVNAVYPPLIFDKFLVTHPDGIPLARSYGSLINGLDASLPFDQWLERFRSSDALAVSKKLYELATTPRAIRFQLGGDPSNPKSFDDPENYVVLHTSYPQFKKGSTLSHVDQEMYTDTADFLLRPEAPSGVTVDVLSKGKFPIGPKTIRVLNAMGYKTNVVNSAAGFALGSASNFVGWIGCWTIIFVLKNFYLM